LPTVDASTLPRAVAAGTAVAAACGLRVDDAVVVHNSNRLAVHLQPCEVLARVTPRARQLGAEFEVEVARRLHGTGAPAAPLDPRIEPRVYEQDEFAVTLWTYYETGPAHEIPPDDYANALWRLHAGMRQADLAGVLLPHVTDRVDEAQRLVVSAVNHPFLTEADLDLLTVTLQRMTNTIAEWDAREQLLHGEPHPGNVLWTREGPLFIDLETCCRGPVEFDIAHATINESPSPMEVAARYPGADPSLVHACWTLMLAMVTAWRCEPDDDLPNGRTMATGWLHQLRAIVGP
jgi:aminoglycoside phosphotransferase (APT) family kinase protein